MTLVEIKRRVKPGQVYDIINPRIERESGTVASTVRATVSKTLSGSFFVVHPLGESQIHWPLASQVSMDSSGVIELGRGGQGQSGTPWLTFTPVRASQLRPASRATAGKELSPLDRPDRRVKLNTSI